MPGITFTRYSGPLTFIALSLCFGLLLPASGQESTTTSVPAASDPTPPAATPSTGEKPSDGNSGMYGGEFKCSDGYNPDTDPTLHPPDQNAKVRMLINAQAQKAHEEQLTAEKENGGPPERPTGEHKATGALPEKAEKKLDLPEKKEGAEKKEVAEKKGEDAKKNPSNDADSSKKKSDAAATAQFSPIKEALYLIGERKYQDSVTLLTNLLAKNGNNVDARYLLAITYVGLRKYPEATEQYNKVISLSPNSRQAALSIEGLKKISH